MKLFLKREIRQTTIISCWLVCLLIGLYVPYQKIFIRTFWLTLVPLLILAAIKFKKLRTVLVCVAMALVGMWRSSVVFSELQKYEPLYFNNIRFTASVADDPGFNGDRNQFEFAANQIKLTGKSLPGKVVVGVRKDPELRRGDAVVVSGKIKPSVGTSRQGSMSMAEVKVVHKNESLVEDIRQNFLSSIQSSLPEPADSLGLGYLVGLRVNIPKSLSEQLQIVGLTHIIAVSGYNLTVIVQAVRRIFEKRSAYQSVAFSVLLTAGFIVITGGSAPIVRAAVVCGFSLVAWYYGRTIRPVLLLLFSGALTALINPLYIWGDPGWYLSFLAFGGVLILAPLISKLFFHKSIQESTIPQLLLESICAQLCTIPYTLFLFGGVSIIAPIANLLILPLIPIIMLLVFIVGLVGMILPQLAATISVFPAALLSLQLWCIEKLSTMPNAHSNISISLTSMISLFLMLIITTLVLTRLYRRRVIEESLKMQNDLL